jgi:hypothetical protein
MSSDRGTNASRNPMRVVRRKKKSQRSDVMPYETDEPIAAPQALNNGISEK